jgi:PhnB protein
MAVKPIPDGYHAVTPYLTVKGAAKLLDFITTVFGATEKFRMPRPDGTIGHSEVKIGDSTVMLAEASGQYPPMTAGLYVYVPDTDAAYKRALKAGATSLMEPADQFYGDRNAGVKDAFGITWWIATHVEDVPPGELEKRAAAAQKK